MTKTAARQMYQLIRLASDFVRNVIPFNTGRFLHNSGQILSSTTLAHVGTSCLSMF